MRIQEAVAAVLVVAVMALPLSAAGSTVSPILPNATLVGCFSTGFVESTLFYRVPHSLSWQQGVALCDHRLTRYAAVQAEPGSPSYNFIFCGNDIVEHSEEVNGSLCQGCADNPGVSCGGDHVMAVYKIRDSTPLALLLATDTGVEMYRSDYNSSTTQIINYQNTIGAIDIYLNKDSLFFESNNIIFSSQYGPYSMAYVQPKPIEISGNKNLLTVDWVDNRTYWSDDNSGIFASDLSGSNIKYVYRDIVQEFTIDPFERLLYFVRNDNLYSLHLERQTVMHFDLTTLHMTAATLVALDIHNQKVYVVGSQDGGWYLASMAYDGTQVKVLLHDPVLKDVFALDVFSDEVVWGVHDQSQYRLYRCRLTPRCYSANLTLLYQSTQIINDFTIYHPEKQTPSAKYLCAQLRCSHNCSSTSPSVAECTCPEGMVKSSDSRTCRGDTDYLLNTTYVGCYSSSYAESQNNKIHQSLSWKECVHYCNNRLTKYVGIQAEQSSPTFNNPLCGNHILDHSTMVNGSLCKPCLDNPNKLCGREHAMAVYQLRDSSPLAVLLATDSGVKMISENSTSASLKVTFTEPITALDLNFLGDEIFFISEKRIWKSYFSPFSMSYVPPKPIVEPHHDISDMAVDWEFNSLFWNYYHDRLIYEGDLEGRNATPIFNHADLDLPQSEYHIHDMAVDPFQGLLFFVESGTLYSLELYNKTLHKHDEGKFRMKTILKIALDTIREMIYMIGTDDNKNFYLVSCGYFDTKFKLLHTSPHLDDSISLDVLEDEVVWVHLDGGKYIVCRCKMSPRCLTENLRVIYESTEVIRDIKIYHPDVQPIRTKYVCSNLGCSHSCMTHPVPMCTCPDTKRLGSDRKTCQDKTTESSNEEQNEVTVPSQTEGSSMNALTETVTKVNLITADGSEEDEKNTSESPVSTTIANEQKRGEIIPVEVPNSEKSSDVSQTRQMFEDQSKLQDSKLFSVEVFNSIVNVLILSLLIVIIYLLLKPHRKKGHFGYSYKPAAELEELTNTTYNI